MRVALFTLILWACTAAFAQPPAYFSELRGIDAGIGFTHLFYRVYVDESDSVYHPYTNHIYHWDLDAASETLFLQDFHVENYWNLYGQSVNDFEFFYNNPDDYIAGGTVYEIDPSAVIWLPQNEFFLPWFGEITNIEISQNNPQLIYASLDYQGLIKSTNRGIDWEAIASTQQDAIDIIALSPFDDQVLFAVSNFAFTTNLLKSIDGAATFYTVNDSIDWGNYTYGGTRIFFDVDSVHAYAITHFTNGKMLISEDAGESWTVAREDSSKFRLAIDEFAAGKLYLSSGKDIYFSEDFGQNFTPYVTLNRDIIDLYKEPFSDILYAATKFNIYKITPTNTVSIKSLPIVGITDEPPGVISQFALHQNYPNPFNPATTIVFDLPTTADIELSVFDAAGREVATLFRGRKTAGRHAVEFDGRNLASGVYFYRLKTGNRVVLSRKMLLIK